MDFAYTGEQELLRDSLGRFLRDHYDFNAFRRASAEEPGRRPELWKNFAKMGLLGAALPEAYGGLGGSAVETMIVTEAFGRALAIEPFIPSVVAGGGFLRLGGSEAQKQYWLPRIAAGDALFAFGFAEPQGSYDLADIRTRASRRSGAFLLNGRKAMVLGAPVADQLVVTARTAGDRRDVHGISVFLVDPMAKGVSLQSYRTQDGMAAAEISFDDVDIAADRLVGEADGGLPLVERVCDECVAAYCADALGAMRVLHESTLEYAKTRRQFGVPIGSFQALQHRMVDMFMRVEQSASMVLMATLKLASPAPERKKAVSAAKAYLGEASRFVGQNAIQIHGGMGMTDELALGHYFKRVTMFDTLFGNVDHHLNRYAALVELQENHSHGDAETQR